MNQREGDKALRDLFQEVGDLSAPESMDARILQRIALLPRTAILPEKPLLPKWTWLIAAALVVGLLVFPGIGRMPKWMSNITSFSWEEDVPYRWVFAGLGACIVLLSLDTWLNTRRLYRSF